MLTDKQILDGWLAAMEEALRQRGCAWIHGDGRLNAPSSQLSFDVDDIDKWRDESFYEGVALPTAFVMVDKMGSKSLEFQGLIGGFAHGVLVQRKGDISMRLYPALDALADKTVARIDIRYSAR